MNAKHYVSLSAAKKLKELGYKEQCLYSINGIGHPTLLEAMDWLEENFAFHIGVYWRDGFWCYKTYFIYEELKIIDDNIEGMKDRNECMQKAIEKALELL